MNACAAQNMKRATMRVNFSYRNGQNSRRLEGLKRYHAVCQAVRSHTISSDAIEPENNGEIAA